MNGLEETEKDPRIVYADIIGLPHWDSPEHPRMSLSERAAQFAPYAALVGYGDLVKEEARETGEKPDLSEDEKEEINCQLSALADALAAGRRPGCRVSWFAPDERKDGGEIRTAEKTVKRIDPIRRKLVFTDRNAAGVNDEISLDRIVRLSAEQAGENPAG